MLEPSTGGSHRFVEKCERTAGAALGSLDRTRTREVLCPLVVADR